MRVMVTGAAGFIGSHVCRRLLSMGMEVYGVDLSSGKEHPLIRSRLAAMHDNTKFHWIKGDVAYLPGCCGCDAVLHLAAEPGIQHSIIAPRSTVHSNVQGFATVLDLCAKANVPLVYASSSSVTGNGNGPISLYAATKVANEAMAKAYAHTHGLKSVGLRLFTVYGPWGRPDMAMWKFADAICRNDPEPIPVYDTERDWTYVEDVVEAIVRVVTNVPPGAMVCDFGPGIATRTIDALEWLTKGLGHSARIRTDSVLLPGDVRKTRAHPYEFSMLWGSWPLVSVEEGTRRFAEWFKEYKETACTE